MFGHTAPTQRISCYAHRVMFAFGMKRCMPSQKEYADPDRRDRSGDSSDAHASLNQPGHEPELVDDESSSGANYLI